MLPVTLKLQGINSYQGEHIIEFDKLLESKIFGIFGEVGSGKSTILEAISYVLYGKYERLKGEKVSYNLMNLKSNRFLIDFVFVVENENKYRFVVEGKRNSKNFEDVSVKRKYYIWSNDKWLPKEKLDAKEIIGLSFENFNRTIIIPQGKFMEFINLSGTERSKMLKEIFNLYKYDLLDKVAVLQKQNDIDISILEDRLSQIKDINKEAIKKNKILLKEILRQQGKKKQELNQKDKEFKILENLRADFNKLNELKAKYNQLLAQKPEIEKKEQKIKEYEFCVLNFKSDLERLDEVGQKIVNLESNISLKRKKIDEIESNVDKIKKKLNKLSEEYVKLDKYKKEKDEYGIVINIKKVEEDILFKKELLKKLENEFDELKIISDSIKNRIDDEKKLIFEKEKQMPDITLLAEIQNWYMQAESMKKTVVELINAIAGKKMELKKLKDSLINIFDKKDIEILNIDTTLELSALIKSLEKHKEVWKKGLENLQKEKDKIVLKDKLKEYAHSLEKGKPCPVCGSMEHPNPLKIEDDFKEEINGIEERIAKGQALIDKTEKYLEKLKELKIKISEQSNFIRDQQRSYDEKKNQYEEFLKGFKWKDYSIDNPEKVEAALEDAKSLKIELEKLRKNLSKSEKETVEIDQKKNLVNKKINDSGKVLSAAISKQSTLSTQLNELNYNDFLEISIKEIEKRQDDLNRKILNTEKEYVETGKVKNNLEIELAKEKADLENMKIALSESMDIKSKLEKKIYENLAGTEFNNFNIIKKIIGKELDINMVKKEIDKFKIALVSTEKELKSLQGKLKENSFDEERFNKLRAEILTIKKEIENLIADKSRLENLINDQESKLLKKESFLAEHENRIARAEDLKLMRSLFTSNGFVNFISTVRLQEVVNHANSRFMKLTKGKMKIELNRDNSFDVVDFLNNGEKRSIKSLSGGQTFQASLSLALALASIVQQQNRSKQNFFFLDEGFGTQDEESLRLVFDTIKSLRKENRIVGLISHVSQLKEEVNTYLEILNDENTGSRIIRSWEG